MLLILNFIHILGLGCSSSSSSNVRHEKSTSCKNTFESFQFTEEQLEQIELIGALPPKESLLPDLLSQTGLYSDIVSHEIHEAMLHYTPQYQLWSDGEDKDRWIYIPECELIDSSDPDDWIFPVGTRFFKEFRRDGKKIETRIITRFGPFKRDFAYASYIWNHEETEAIRIGETGQMNALGTGHNIPSKQQCLQCHGSYSFGGGRPSRGLGFSTLQLNHEDTQTNLETLIIQNKLTVVPQLDVNFPGSNIEKDALGYLHANCGNCHNDSPDGIPHNDLNLWVNTFDSTVEQTGTWKTAVNQPTSGFKDQHTTLRIDTINPQKSALLYRMTERGNIAQMPPIASTIHDLTGIETVRAWIEELQ